MSVLNDGRDWHVSASVVPCSACDAPLSRGARKSCAACRSAYYCSAACQNAHWAQHRDACKDMCKKRGEALAAEAKDAVAAVFPDAALEEIRL